MENTDIVNYPPEEILDLSSKSAKKIIELVILWMLNNNDFCTSVNFTEIKNSKSKPIIHKSTLYLYLKKLLKSGYIVKPAYNTYVITSKGRDRFYDLSKGKNKKRKLNYPPDIIKRKRNYDHWILWMLYNNNYCKWANFLNDPLNINQSSLSKNLNKLIEDGLVIKENKRYRITQLGESEYSNILRMYDLDRQSILNEESKRIKEITKKTIRFFEKYGIVDEDVQFRYLNNVLKLDYGRVKTMLTNEEDFDKILLFISMNHPNQYPYHISLKDFSNKYGIKKSKIEYYIDEIVENDIYPIKFFKLANYNDEYYYFQQRERIELILRAITEDHITKFTYLSKLYSRSLDLHIMINAILDDICGVVFNENLKKPLTNFLYEYLNYLAYNVKAKVELRESYDKLEGIIWQDMIDLFYIKSNDELKDQYEEKIKEIDRKIELNPEDLDLYHSKISILLYYDQFDEVLNILNNMMEIFPKNEIDIKMKKASVLRRKRDIYSGLEIIEELIGNYPDDIDLLNYKAYWLQYLNKRQEAIKLIQDLVNRFPNNVMYHDTYGEILMYFKEYKKAKDEFQKTLEVALDEWYINQTYIKLGICYKELNKLNFAVENLKKGKLLTIKNVADEETKQKWLKIADLFLLDIEQRI